MQFPPPPGGGGTGECRLECLLVPARLARDVERRIGENCGHLRPRLVVDAKRRAVGDGPLADRQEARTRRRLEAGLAKAIQQCVPGRAFILAYEVDVHHRTQQTLRLALSDAYGNQLASGTRWIISQRGLPLDLTERGAEVL